MNATRENKVAFTAVVNDNGCMIGLAEQGISGYLPMPKYGYFQTYDEAAEKADALNKEVYGLDLKEAALIVLSSMREVRHNRS